MGKRKKRHPKPRVWRPFREDDFIEGDESRMAGFYHGSEAIFVGDADYDSGIKITRAGDARALAAILIECADWWGQNG